MEDYKILLVDRDPHSLNEIGNFLDSEDYLATKASSAEEAIEMLNKKNFDLVVTDNLSILKKVKELKPEMMVMILTSDYDVTLAIDALRLGADDYLLKPFAKAELLKNVTYCLEKLELRRRNSKSNEQILDILKTMTHDIRNPLISMSATLKLLNRGYYGNMDSGVADRLKHLLTKTISLIGISEDYLCRTFSIDDDLDIGGEALDLHQDIIDPVLDEFSSELQDHQIRIDKRLASIPNHPIAIKGSKIGLKAVFRNLLQNAIKYGDKDYSITIGIEDNGSSYRLNVYNNGNPIPEEKRDRLFTKFAYIGNGNNGNGSTKGLGLGLYLTKKIIQKHGGDIWYEAEENGSNFVFTLPREEQTVRSGEFGV